MSSERWWGDELSKLIQALYKTAAQPFLFGFNPESAHNWAVKRMRELDSIPLAKDVFEHVLRVDDPALHVKLHSLNCPNPVGLAAGFDKSAELINILPSFGFGFIEVGTLTPLVQEGQKKPRLFRLKKEKALINRMGFNNSGVKAAAERLANREKRSVFVPLGINIGKGRNTILEEAVDDYLTAFEHVYPYADYVVINVSSPNTPGLRDLQAAEHLRVILKCLANKNKELAEKSGDPIKPLFTKISPDLHEESLVDMAQMGVELNVGFIATNTTTDQSVLHTHLKENGGISGKPLKEKSNKILKRLYQLTKGVVPIIGVGGVFTAEDAYEKIQLGASLVQIYTGWIYEGPGLIPKINKGLLKLMKRDGLSHIREAVGTRA